MICYYRISDAGLCRKPIITSRSLDFLANFMSLAIIVGAKVQASLVFRTVSEQLRPVFEDCLTFKIKKPTLLTLRCVYE